MLCDALEASHNIAAYILPGGEKGYCDDGDYGLGRCILNTMKDLNVRGRVVFITRRYGGTKLGFRRFTIVQNLTKSVCQNEDLRSLVTYIGSGEKVIHSHHGPPQTADPLPNPVQPFPTPANLATSHPHQPRDIEQPNGAHKTPTAQSVAEAPMPTSAPTEAKQPHASDMDIDCKVLKATGNLAMLQLGVTSTPTTSAGMLANESLNGSGYW